MAEGPAAVAPGGPLAGDEEALALVARALHLAGEGERAVNHRHDGQPPALCHFLSALRGHLESPYLGKHLGLLQNLRRPCGHSIP